MGGATRVSAYVLSLRVFGETNSLSEDDIPFTQGVRYGGPALLQTEACGRRLLGQARARPLDEQTAAKKILQSQPPDVILESARKGRSMKISIQ